MILAPVAAEKNIKNAMVPDDHQITGIFRIFYLGIMAI